MQDNVCKTITCTWSYIEKGGREHERKGGWLEKKEYCGKIIDLEPENLDLLPRL